MERDALTFERVTIGEFQPAVFDEFADELRVVHHLVVAAKLRILVFQYVEAVGAAGDDLLDAVAVEDGDVLGGLHLVQKLVASALRRVAGAAFLAAQDREFRA